MVDEKRLIFVEKAVKHLENEIYWNESTKAAIRAFLRTLPAADAMEVVHGRWEYGRWEQGHWVKGNERCRCSVCHRDFAVDNLNIWHGCPQCLAKMDGGNEDG